MIRLAHMIDDLNVGGVTQRMKNFERPEFLQHLTQEVCAVNTMLPPPRVEADTIIVHFTLNWRKLAWLAALRARNPGARVIIEEHSYTAAFERRHVSEVARFRTMLRVGYRMADMVVAVSENQAAWMRRARLVPEGRLHAISASRPLEEFLGIEAPVRDGPLRLGCLGRFCEQKGFEDAIEAFARLRPGSATLTIGGLGPLEGELRQKAMGLQGVRFIGQVTDTPAFYSGIDVLVMPSRFEAFGLTALEARAAGRPVISYAVDGLIEQAKCAGMLVQPDDVHRLSLAMNMLANTELGALSHLARRAARGRYIAHVAAWRELLLGTERSSCPALAVVRR